MAVGAGVARARAGELADFALTTTAAFAAFAAFEAFASWVAAAGPAPAAAAGPPAAALPLRSGRCALPTNSTTTAAITAINAGPASAARIVCPSVAPSVTVDGVPTPDARTLGARTLEEPGTLETVDMPDTLDNFDTLDAPDTLGAPDSPDALEKLDTLDAVDMLTAGGG